MIAAKEKAKLYIIDEPLNNLEINKIKIFSNFIRQQIIEGKRFLISSHLSLFPFPDLNLTIKEYNLVKIDNSFDKCLGEIDDLGFYKEVE
jgi:ABC-type transport system involved in cytochrome c biogenesis ATPase subunit